MRTRIPTLLILTTLALGAAPRLHAEANVLMTTFEGIDYLIMTDGAGVTAIPLGPTAPAAGAGGVAGGLPVVIAAGVYLDYQMYLYYWYTQQMANNPGSEPANALTDYENPANYWQQFWYFYGLASPG
jgi:hypothetical protein